VDNRTNAVYSGVLASPIRTSGYCEYNLGDKEAPHPSPHSETRGGLVQAAKETSGISFNGTQQKPSAFRRLLSRVTGVDPTLEPEETDVVELARIAHERSARLVESRGNVMEDVMFPNRR
jgi:hypothetical protein